MNYDHPEVLDSIERIAEDFKKVQDQVSRESLARILFPITCPQHLLHLAEAFAALVAPTAIEGDPFVAVKTTKAFVLGLILGLRHERKGWVSQR